MMQAQQMKRRQRQKRRIQRIRQNALICLLVLASFIVGFTSATSLHASESTNGATHRHTESVKSCWEPYWVRSGDTLWVLVQDRLPGDPRSGIEQVRKYNELQDLMLKPGQEILLPGKCNSKEVQI